MPTLELKPTHKLVKAYYAALAQFDLDHVSHESAVRQPFLDLLTAGARQRGWSAKAKLANPGATGEPEDQLHALFGQLLADSRKFKDPHDKAQWEKLHSLSNLPCTVIATTP